MSAFFIKNEVFFISFFNQITRPTYIASVVQGLKTNQKTSSVKLKLKIKIKKEFFHLNLFITSSCYWLITRVYHMMGSVSIYHKCRYICHITCGKWHWTTSYRIGPRGNTLTKHVDQSAVTNEQPASQSVFPIWNVQIGGFRA